MYSYNPNLSRKIGLFNAVVFQELNRIYHWEIGFGKENILNDIFYINGFEYVELYLSSGTLGITEKQFQKALDNLELMRFIETGFAFNLKKNVQVYRILKVQNNG